MAINYLANLNLIRNIARMLTRNAFDVVKNRLSNFDSVAVLGPRQTGKTTLARQIADETGGGASYLDLESAVDRRKLDDPEAYFAANREKLIVLDEIQRAPEIFQVLRGEIDARRRQNGKVGKFLLLGSAAMDLLRQSSESLAGRISFVELTPLQPDEIANVSPESIDNLWLRGGFPQSFLRESDAASLQWRLDFIRTYVERDIPKFGLQVDAERLELFWRMLANDQGELFNAQRYARSLGVSGHTIARYLEILEKLLLVRNLKPWFANSNKRLVKAPRPFVRDSGILHALLAIETTDALRGNSVVGKSWEGFVIEALIDAAGDRARPYFYRTAAGAEADLILEMTAQRCWAFEIKLSSAPKVDRGFHTAADDLAVERRILVHRGNETFPMRGGIEAMTLMGALAAVRAE
jgi:predicted AAA+ superfamily ATPase